jgi:hypothetical protein
VHPERTFVDMASKLSLLDLVVLGDAEVPPRLDDGRGATERRRMRAPFW